MNKKKRFKSSFKSCIAFWFISQERKDTTMRVSWFDKNKILLDTFVPFFSFSIIFKVKTLLNIQKNKK